MKANREDLLEKLDRLHKSYKLCEDHFEQRMFTSHLRNRLNTNVILTLFPSLEGSSSSFIGDHTYFQSSLVPAKNLVLDNGVLVPATSNTTSTPQTANSDIGRARSTLSVSDVEYYLNLPVSCPTSPAASTLTLTPGRIRNIDQDMENLRASRQDNPFIQKVIASRESLLESSLEEESDNASLMSKELSLDLDVDPLSLPEMHEHMIRSPPPTNWPRSPNFRAFNFPCGKDDGLQVEVNQAKEKSKSTEIKPKHSSWNDGSDSSLRSFKAHYYHDRFSLLTTSSLRPSAEDSIRLMGED